jgi:hypothetical protein
MRTVSFWLSPIGFLGHFGRKSSETLDFQGKMRKRHAETQSHLGNPGSDAPGPRPGQGRTDAKVAAAVDMGKDMYRKAKEVVEAAEREPEKYGDLPPKMDATGKVDGAFQEMKKRREPPQPPPAPKHPHSDRVWRWLTMIVGEWHAMDTEYGGIAAMLEERDKWDWEKVRRAVVPLVEEIDKNLGELHAKLLPAAIPNPGAKQRGTISLIGDGLQAARTLAGTVDPRGMRALISIAETLQSPAGREFMERLYHLTPKESEELRSWLREQLPPGRADVTDAEAAAVAPDALPLLEECLWIFTQPGRGAPWEVHNALRKVVRMLARLLPDEQAAWEKRLDKPRPPKRK